MKLAYDSPIVEGVTRLMVPLIQIFAFYVIAHGHYGPGGGFQGGVILAASIMLLRLSMGAEVQHYRLPTTATILMGSCGLLLFVLVGFLSTLSGEEFLNYGALPVDGVAPPTLRYLSILVVEIGIALTVWGVLVSLFDQLAGGES